MANRYVRSGAGGAGTGADWANAFTSIVAAVAADSAGDVFFIADDHAESTAGAVAPNIAGTPGTPSYFYGVSDAGSVPPVAADLVTTAAVVTTGGTSTITLNSAFYMYGINFTAGSGASGGGFVVANGGTADRQYYKNCTFTFGTTGSVTFQIGNTSISNPSHFQDCTFTFAATGQTFSIFSPTHLYNCTINGSAIPTTVFTVQSDCPLLDIEGCDLSAIGSGKTLFSLTRQHVIMKNCKLNAAVTIMATGSTIPSGAIVDVVNCDSGDTITRNERYMREGKVTTELTIIRTGGASNGTTGYSWKIETSAESEIPQPFECPVIPVWNETVGSAVTYTIEGIWGGGAVPDNNDIWVEAEYQGTSGFPKTVRATGGVATPLHTASNHASSSETWGGSTTKFKMTVTFTPQEKGPVYLFIKAALASQTFYVCPKPTKS